MRGTGNRSPSMSRSNSLSVSQPVARTGSVSLPRGSFVEQNQTLPDYRAKKGKGPTKVSAQVLFTGVGTLITVLFIYLNLWVSPRNFAASSHSNALLADNEALKQGENGAGVNVWPQIPAAYVGGTDKFTPSREGEMLSSWDPHFGLEVDAWDPRTHDPRNKPDWFGAPVVTKKSSPEFHLTAVVSARITKGRQQNITTFECLQWLEYLKYGGVERVFWYDTARSGEEMQERGLRAYIQKGFVTYHHFHSMFPGKLEAGVEFEKDQSTLHCLSEYGQTTHWLLSADLNEYVFMPTDVTPGFLERRVRVYDAEYPDVSQLLLQAMLFQGESQKPSTDLLIERLQLRKAETEGVALGAAAKMKAILKPVHCQRVYRKNPHHFEMRTGKTVALPAGVMRMNVYGNVNGNGTETATGGAQTKETKEGAKLVQTDPSIQPIANEIKIILKVKGKRG